MVKLEVFYTQTCVTLMKRKKGSQYEQHGQFWIGADELPAFLADWHKLGADATVRDYWGRSKANVPIDPPSNILPEATDGDTPKEGGAGDTGSLTQLGFGLW
jgi:hypothetical protein